MLQPGLGRGASGVVETPQEGAFAHQRPGRQFAHAQRLMQALPGPLHDSRQVAARGTADRCGNELRLAAGALRRHHQAPGHAVGHLGAEIPGHQVQAGIDTGGAAGGSDQLPGIDIEHIRVHPDIRETLGQLAGVAPVSGGATTIQQPGRRQNEHPGADRQQPRTALVGLAQRFQQLRRRRLLAAAPAGNDDGPRLLQQLQAPVGQHLDPAQGTHRAGVHGGDGLPVPGEIELRPGQAEDLHGNAELEGAKAVVGQDRDQTGRIVHLAESYQSVSGSPL